MLFQELTLAKPDKLNDSLYTRFVELSGTGRVRQSHHFAGRFENTYIEESDIPAIATLLTLVKQHAGQLLGVPTEKLKTGFWFNTMEAGQRTARITMMRMMSCSRRCITFAYPNIPVTWSCMVTTGRSWFSQRKASW
jgi:hypothetical protein